MNDNPPSHLRSVSFAGTVWFCLAAILLCWLLMQAVHEFGHMLHAWMSGQRVTNVVLHPLAISRTDVAPNDAPRFVVWGGFVWGIAIPVGLWYLFAWFQRRGKSLVEFFAAFCLVVNGVYWSTVMWSPSGDTRTLLNAGESPVWAFLLGATATIVGVWRWHSIDRRWNNEIRVHLRRQDIVTVTIALVVVVVLECLLSPRG